MRFSPFSANIFSNWKPTLAGLLCGGGLMVAISGCGSQPQESPTAMESATPASMDHTTTKESANLTTADLSDALPIPATLTSASTYSAEAVGATGDSAMPGLLPEEGRSNELPPTALTDIAAGLIPAAPSPRAIAAFQKLLHAAENGEPEAWTAAEAELQELGSEVVSALIPHLSSDSPLAREMAVMFLAQLGPDAAPAATALTATLNDPSPFVQVNAAALLTTFEQTPPLAITVLIQLAEHPEANLRLTAISALGNAPEFSSQIVPVLTAALQNPDEAVRTAAAAALERLKIQPGK